MTITRIYPGKNTTGDKVVTLFNNDMTISARNYVQSHFSTDETDKVILQALYSYMTQSKRRPRTFRSR